jgi:branched-chain amino acid transport system permease protein
VGFGEIVRLVLLNWTPVTKGAAGLVGIPLPTVPGFVIRTEQHFFYLILASLLAGVFIARRIADSKIGRTYRAVREDELAAAAMGVNINRYKISAFIISAMFAGFAGSLFGSFSGVTSPDNFTFDESVGFLCMSVIGGNRSIIGAVIGAFGLTVVSEALRVFQGFRLVIYGCILIFTVIFMPQGIIGLLQRIRGVFPAKETD